MKMIKGLTKANIKGTGIKTAPEYDFTDDGNRFRGFVYKGIPMTQCVSGGFCFLSIRIDYLDNDFVNTEWYDTEEHRLCNKYNYVEEVDLDDLLVILEQIIEKRNEMNETAKTEVIDINPLEQELTYERKRLYGFLEKVRENLEWWYLTPNEIRDAKRDYDILSETLTKLNSMFFADMPKKELRTYRERLNNDGCISYNAQESCCYFKELREYMSKRP